MLRSVAAIAAALHIANPSLSHATRYHYAAVLQKTAYAYSFDPFTAVAIGEHESRWIASTIGGSGHACYGLFQVCVRSAYPYCRGEGFDGARCKARRAELLDGAVAIHVLGRQIDQWRTYCRAATGHPALFARWLSGYQGVDARRGTTCNQRKIRGRWRDARPAKMTTWVMRYRLRLVRRVR